MDEIVRAIITDVMAVFSTVLGNRSTRARLNSLDYVWSSKIYLVMNFCQTTNVFLVKAIKQHK